MNKKELSIKRVLLSVLLSFEFCILVYSFIPLYRIQNPLFLLMLSFAVFILGISVQFKADLVDQKKFLYFFISVPVSCVLLFLTGLCIYKLDYFIWDRKDHSPERQTIDSGFDHMFADKKVLIFVPHEDDDVLLMGGVLEQYINYGSDVYVVFESTGDFGVSDSQLSIGTELGQTRMKEAVNVLTTYGLDEDHIIFLGFGDRYSDTHLYNFPDDSDEVVITKSGFDHTYALESHPAYRDGEFTTKKNLIDDFKSIILDLKPDIIFSIDYDEHQDHRAVSLIFEKVMGEILKQQDSYKPVVYKGFAYSTALYSKYADYYSSVNPLQTFNPYENEYMQETNTFLWKDRIRFPVSVNTLTHHYQDSDTNTRLLMYVTQQGAMKYKAKAVVNSDKVFWGRRTDSLLYNADISASSGNAGLLNDFMLFDSSDIIDINTDFSIVSGVWIPSADDTDRTVNVVLKEPQYIESICIYDNPCMYDNVINAMIIFDDGSVIETGALMPNGSATVINVSKQNVRSFKIYVTETFGERAGLTEIEAFSSENDPQSGFIKLTDEQNNFVYDYYLNDRDSIRLNLYRYNYDVPLNDSYVIVTDNKNIKTEISDNQLIVNCPNGQSGFIKITSADGLVSDTIRISNKRLTFFFMMGVQMFEFYQKAALVTGFKLLLMIMIILMFSMVVPDQKKS